VLFSVSLLDDGRLPRPLFEGRICSRPICSGKLHVGGGISDRTAYLVVCVIMYIVVFIVVVCDLQIFVHGHAPLVRIIQFIQSFDYVVPAREMSTRRTALFRKW
jgi:hypothetical protein